MGGFVRGEVVVMPFPFSDLQSASIIRLLRSFLSMRRDEGE